MIGPAIRRRASNVSRTVSRPCWVLPFAILEWMRLTARPLTGRVGVVASLAGALLLAAAPACRGEPPQALPATQAVALSAATDTQAAAAHLENLAESGRFGEVLARL